MLLFFIFFVVFVFFFSKSGIGYSLNYDKLESEQGLSGAHLVKSVAWWIQRVLTLSQINMTKVDLPQNNFFINLESTDYVEITI